ncbi:MAG: hypothetical protein ACXVEB_15230, partial [Bacteroidia bacterium]
NRGGKCAKYVRNGEKKFDVVKMSFNKKLSDSSVSAYATYLGIPPKFKMKVYSTAPVGTLVEILLGSKNGNNAYPAGTNSQYQAYTTVTNAWEELEFKFSQIPKGSETSTSQIDQLTILFNPNSTTSDTYYFDDITGPSLAKKEPELISKTNTNQAEENKSTKNDGDKTSKNDDKKVTKNPDVKKPKKN